MSQKMIVNGSLVATDQAHISVFDRSVMFADGLYEVTAVYNGHMFRYDLHWDRLNYGAGQLNIPLPFSRSELEEQLQQLIELNMPDVSGVYLQLTRGAAMRTHSVPNAKPNWFAFAMNPTPKNENQSAITVSDNRFGLCHIKTTGILPNSLARQQAVSAGCREAIFVRDGFITEATSASVFAVVEGQLLTHPLANILPGITRKLIIDLAQQQGIDVCQRAMTLNEFLQADEVFITGTISEVAPITEVDGRKIGSGRPGPVTLEMQRLYRELIKTTLAISM